MKFNDLFNLLLSEMSDNSLESILPSLQFKQTTKQPKKFQRQQVDLEFQDLSGHFR